MFVMEWYYDFVPNSEYSQKICIVSDIKINIPNVQDQIIFLLKFEREIFHSKYVPLSISIFHDIRSYRDSTSNVCIFFFFFFFFGKYILKCITWQLIFQVERRSGDQAIYRTGEKDWQRRILVLSEPIQYRRGAYSRPEW